MRIAILGGAGHGAHAADSVKATRSDDGLGGTLLGFLNDRLPTGATIAGAPVLGPFASWRELPDDTCFLAPLFKPRFMEERLRIIKGLGIPENRWATVIDPRNAVAADAQIGHGCLVSPFATLGPGARIGPFTALRNGAYVGHDCSLGAFVFVGPNATVCGAATIGDGGYIGPGALVGEGRNVGRFAVVGGGSVVQKDVPDYHVVSGSPARRVIEPSPRV